MTYSATFAWENRDSMSGVAVAIFISDTPISDAVFSYRNEFSVLSFEFLGGRTILVCVCGSGGTGTLDDDAPEEGISAREGAMGGWCFFLCGGGQGSGIHPIFQNLPPTTTINCPVYLRFEGSGFRV